MTVLFPDVGRVKVPDLDQSDIPEMPDYSAEMARAAQDARIRDLQHSVQATIDHSNRLARMLAGIQSDDIRSETNSGDDGVRLRLDEKDYEEVVATAVEGTTDFKLFAEGGTVKLAAGDCAYYKSGGDAWDTQTVAQTTIGIPGSSYRFVYIRRTLNARIPIWRPSRALKLAKKRAAIRVWR